jgi:hypothetical protein
MGGALDSVAKMAPKEGLAGQAFKAAGVGKKKKKDSLSPQARKNLAAKSAAPLLQQTVLTPDDTTTGAGTALL